MFVFVVVLLTLTLFPGCSVVLVVMSWYGLVCVLIVCVYYVLLLALGLCGFLCLWIAWVWWFVLFWFGICGLRFVVVLITDFLFTVYLFVFVFFV